MGIPEAFLNNLIRKRLYLFVFLILPLYSCSQNNDDNRNPIEEIPEGFYQNPVFEPVFADPSIVKADDGFFYAYATEDNWGGTSGYHVVPIIRSHDLVKWEYVTDAFTQKPNWKNQGFIWAPDINIIDGTFYMYYSYSLWGDSNPGIGLAISSTPNGPFIDQGKLFLSNEIGVANSIDPFYIEDEGKKFLFWGSFHGLHGIELAEDGKSITGEKFQVAGDLLEGTFILKRNGFYYLFGSSGTCCEGSGSTYRLHVARSSNLKGPYVSKTGEDLLGSAGTVILEANTTKGFVGPGHNAEVITDSEGKDWILYHAIDRSLPKLSNGATRRPLMLDELLWENDWPYVQGNQPGIEVQKKPVF